MKTNNYKYNKDNKIASSQLSQKLLNSKTISSLIVLSIGYLLFLVFNSSSISSNLVFPFTYFSTSSVVQNNPSDKMAAADENWKHAKTIYEFSAKDIDGKDVDLSKYK
jgi:hypothetical protein